MKKLRNERGEMMLEVLISVMVVALSVSLLIVCVIYSYHADKKAAEVDVDHYAALTEADSQSVTTANDLQVKVTRNGNTYTYNNINVYGNSEVGLYSYRR